MNKILDNITSLGKSFYGLVIYFCISQILSFIIKSIPNLNNFLYSLILISSELITLILLLIVFRKRIKKDFIDFDKNYKKYLSLGFKVWLIGLMVMIISNNIIYRFIPIDVATNQVNNIVITSKFPLYSVLSIILIGPYIEEIVFRLSFKENLKNKKLYYILSVLIFTSLHVLNGISNPLELIYFIPYGSLAIAFSYILDKTDNIFTTIIIHSFHNALSVVLIIVTSFI